MPAAGRTPNGHTLALNRRDRVAPAQADAGDSAQCGANVSDDLTGPSCPGVEAI